MEIKTITICKLCDTVAKTHNVHNIIVFRYEIIILSSLYLYHEQDLSILLINKLLIAIIRFRLY